jgi:hypothetical protein
MLPSPFGIVRPRRRGCKPVGNHAGRGVGSVPQEPSVPPRVLWSPSRRRRVIWFALAACPLSKSRPKEEHMHGLIYLVGLIVVIMAILSLFGLR